MINLPFSIVLDTRQLVIEHAQYDSVFRFYSLGVRDLITRMYCEAARYNTLNPAQYRFKVQEMVAGIENDFHDFREIELEYHNDKAREYMQSYALTDMKVINVVAAHIAFMARKSWQSHFPQSNCLVSASEKPWLNNDLVLRLHDVSYEPKDFSESFDASSL